MDLSRTLGTLLGFADAPAAPAARAAAERRAPGHSPSQAFEPRARARSMHRFMAHRTWQRHGSEHTRFRVATRAVIGQRSSSRVSKKRFTAESAQDASFDKLAVSAYPEPFDSPLILSLSKDERLAQDKLVEG